MFNESIKRLKIIFFSDSFILKIGVVFIDKYKGKSLNMCQGKGRLDSKTLGKQKLHHIWQPLTLVSRIAKVPGQKCIKIKFGTKVQEHVRSHQKNPHPKEDGNSLKSLMEDIILFSAIYKGGPLIPDFENCSHFKIFWFQTIPYAE